MTYDGSTSAPVNAREAGYRVVATIIDPGYYGQASGKLTVNKANATICFSDLDHVYDGTAKAAHATTHPPGLDVALTYTGNASPPILANEYIVQGMVVNMNYGGTGTANLKINRAALSASAASGSRVYGAANPVFSGTLSGVAPGDGITAAYVSSATPTTNAGLYAVSSPQAIIPKLQDPNGKLPNYLPVLSNGALTISTAPLTVQVIDAGRFFGAANPAFSSVISGIQNQDNITATYTCEAIPESPVGIYDIIPALSDPDNKLGNYSVSLLNGKLFVKAIASPPTANPMTAGVGQTVFFNIVVEDPSNGTLTYVWDFGDGTTADGSSQIHTFVSAGTFNVTCTVSDNLGGSASGNVFVNVVGPVIGFGLDSDGDGLSNDVETAVGVDTVLPAPIMALNVSKASIMLNFAKLGKDVVSLSGTLAVPDAFMPAGQRIVIDVGGVAKGLALGSNGSASLNGDSFKLTLKRKHKAVQANPAARFTAKFKNGDFAGTLAATSNLTNDTLKRAPRPVVISAILNGVALQKVQPLSYTATKGKSGTAK